MKANLVAVFLFLGSSFLFGKNTPIEQVIKSNPKPKGCIEVTSDFSKQQLFDQEQLRALNGKKIEKVELWYTQFKENPKFDQVALNEKRIALLKKAYPALNDPTIEWVWKEQTGATTKEEANDYFHGFRIFSSDDLTTQQRFELDDASNPYSYFTVNASTGGDFTFKNGVIHVPANAVVDPQGNSISGNYTIRFKEYRNAAQIAYSGIPMTYFQGDQELAFNSGGMYEIYGNQNGTELVLQKNITIDYNCTSQLPQLNFYALDPETGLWNKKESNLFEQKEKDGTIAVQGQPAVVEEQKVRLETINPVNNQKEEVKELKASVTDTDVKMSLSPLLWKDYQELEEDQPTFVKNALLEKDAANHKLSVKKDQYDAFLTKLFRTKIHGGFENNTGRTLLAEGADLNHTYPNMIRELNSPSFGVYNCDQQYSIPDLFVLSPKYIDQATGKAIDQLFVACVIDKKINGSFSFDPKQIRYSKKNNNELILFTKNNQVFHVSAEELAKAANDKSPTLALTNISSEVKTSDDLKNYLKL